MQLHSAWFGKMVNCQSFVFPCFVFFPLMTPDVLSPETVGEQFGICKPGFQTPG